MKKEAELWGFLVHGREDEISGLFANFYAWGSHLGEAWHKAHAAALAEGVLDPVLMEACGWKSLDDVDHDEEFVRLAPDVYHIPENSLYPLNDPDPLFVPPAGVVPTKEDGDMEPPLQACFSLHEEKGHVITLAATKERLETTFSSALRLLPDAGRSHSLIISV